jgi:hypothetical protein
MATDSLATAKALAALTELHGLSREAAVLGRQVQALADKIANTIVTLAPAVGVTEEDVYEPLLEEIDGENEGR